MNIRHFSNDKVTQLSNEKENTENEIKRITELTPENI